MKIIIESTPDLTDLDGVMTRVWQGTTERGVKCLVFVHRLAIHPDADAQQFEEELLAASVPSEAVPLPQVLDMRLAH